MDTLQSERIHSGCHIKLRLRSEHKVQDFPTVIYYQMLFETIEPAHRTLASFSQSLESLVNQCPLMFTDSERGRIHVGHPGTTTQQNFLYENRKRQHH